MRPPTFIFFFRIILAIQGLLRFQMNFRMDFSANIIRISVGIALNL